MTKLYFAIFAFSILGHTAVYSQSATEIQKNKEIEGYKRIINLNSNQKEVEKAQKLLTELESVKPNEKLKQKAKLTDEEEQQLMKETLTSKEYDVWKAEKYNTKKNITPILK